MYNALPVLVNSLQTILSNTKYELFCDSKTPKPCITYMPVNDQQLQTCEDFGYSQQSYYIKLWSGENPASAYINSIDSTMRNLGFERVSFNQVVIDEKICYIWLFRGIAKEEFSNIGE